jgi:hypothetical protein
VTVIRIGQIEAKCARSDEMDALCNLHDGSDR